MQRLIISDIDDTLLGDEESLQELLDWLHKHAQTVGFGVATGRSLDSARRQLETWRVPMPDLLITSVGTEIYYGRRMVPDARWAEYIRHQWNRDALEEALEKMPGLRLQEAVDQREFKLSYYIDPANMPSAESITRYLQERELQGRLILAKQETLDVLPIRASKGHAIRFLAHTRGWSLGGMLVAGDSGNDIDMLTCGARAVVVGNHSPELEDLRGREKVYFARRHFASGILEGLRHHGFDRAS